MSLAEKPHSHEHSTIPSIEAQKERLIRLGFHTLRGISEDAYRALLPASTFPRIESHPYTLLVDPIDPLAQIHMLYAIEDDMSDRFGKMETLGNAFGIQTPDIPYCVSLQDGKQQRDKTRTHAAADLKTHERFITLAEGLALRREYPTLWNEKTPYSISIGGTTLRVATGANFVDGKLLLSHADRAASPEISQYYVGNEFFPHIEINACASETYVNKTGGWPTALLL